MRPGGFVHAAEVSCFDGANDVDSDHGRRSVGGRPAGEGTAVRAPAAYSWNGCYGGVNAGGGRVSIDQSVTTVLSLARRTFSSSGRDTSFTGGGQLGCNWQFDPSWVVGVEGDINYLSASHNSGFAFSGEDTVGNQQTKIRWLGTLRARFGYSWNRVVSFTGRVGWHLAT